MQTLRLAGLLIGGHLFRMVSAITLQGELRSGILDYPIPLPLPLPLRDVVEAAVRLADFSQAQATLPPLLPP